MVAIQSKKAGKAITDIALLLGLAACALSTAAFEESEEALRSGANPGDIFAWGTLHCIVSIVFTLVVLIHIWQHWCFIKTLVIKSLYLKNKLVGLLLLTFILTVISFMLYLSGFTHPNLHFHSLVAHIFVFVAIIHVATKIKMLVTLFKKDAPPAS